MRSVNSRRHGSTTHIVVVFLTAIAVGTAAAIVAYGAFVGFASDCGLENSALAEIRIFEGAVGMYRLDVGKYPSADRGLQALLIPPTDAPISKWQGPYLETEVLLDPWYNAYEYRLTPGGESFVVFSIGRDGLLGTKDDIAVAPCTRGRQ